MMSFREMGERGSCFSRRMTSPSRMKGKIMATCMHSMLTACLTHSPLSQPSPPTQQSLMATRAPAFAGFPAIAAPLKGGFANVMNNIIIGIYHYKI